MSWLPKQTVVVPVDFSPASINAVQLARGLVAAPAGLHVLYVLQPAQAMEPGVLWGGMSDEDRKEHVLKNFQKQLAEPEFAGITHAVRLGSPGLEIAAYAEEVRAELIVIPSHGYTGLKHLLLGSVAERVVRHAPCPVLVLRRSN